MSTRHSPNSATRSAGKHPMQAPQQRKFPAELVTYRLEDEMVYVEPAQDYEQALDYARSVFPHLSDIRRSRIAFLVNVRVSGALRKVRIAPMSWPRVMKSLATYEIVDLIVLPEPTTTRAAKSETELATSSSFYASGDAYDAPPRYGSSSMLGGNLCDSARMDDHGFRDSEKSPYFTLQASDVDRLLPPPPSGKRCAGLFSWLTRHF